MPTRNRIKTYIPEAYYHIYNRGLNKQTTFVDDYDYATFLNLLKRYLSKEPVKDKKGREYKTLYGQLELLAFCLQPNHFHLLIYQEGPRSMSDLLHRVTTAYTSYFNKRHRRGGPLFHERFKASHIGRDEYLQHISRYIHLNPKDYENWDFSSLSYYTGKKNADWVKTARIKELFEDQKEYMNFLRDYESHKKILEEIKEDLANSGDL